MSYPGGTPVDTLLLSSEAFPPAMLLFAWDLFNDEREGDSVPRTRDFADLTFDPGRSDVEWAIHGLHSAHAYGFASEHYGNDEDPDVYHIDVRILVHMTDVGDLHPTMYWKDLALWLIEKAWNGTGDFAGSALYLKDND